MANARYTNTAFVLASLIHCLATAGYSQTTGHVTLDPQTLDRLHSPVLRSDLGLLGAQSCAAASCHGGPHPGTVQPSVSRGAEYPLWYENDPHARSWKTISSDASVAMMRRLKIMNGNAIVDQKGFDNCLACHNTTKRFHETRSSIERKEGVGCSGCHGPEQLWVGNHYQTGFDSQNSTEIGFVSNEDLLTRARVCAACHVGDKDRDMNHDIIAAGHPALRYEFATYHARQPKHWRDSEAKDQTFYEAQLWLMGQIAAADATLSLIHTRATESHSISEWPELSAYDCSSCHHSLGLNNARNTPSSIPSQAIAPLSMWNLAGLIWIIRERTNQGQATPEDIQLVDSIQAVRRAMESSTKPDAVHTARVAHDARLALAAWVNGEPGRFERLHFRSHQLGRVAATAAGMTSSFDTWESATQLYLAAVAARESWPGGPSGPMLETSEKLRRELAFPHQISSPSYAISRRIGPSATRAEVRQTTLELVGWLGPISLDQEPMPSEFEPSADSLQQDISDLLQQIRGDGESETRPAPQRDDAPANQPDSKPALQPTKPEQIRPNQTKPKQTITPEDLLKQLEALQGDSSDE